MNKIQTVKARQILDSRGNPTIEVSITTDCGAIGIAGVPSGASKGTYEAVELRDNDPFKYLGKGVQNAVNNVNEIIQNALIGIDVYSQCKIDQIMIELDNTPNKSILGANAIVGVSLAAAKAAASVRKIPLFRYLSEGKPLVMPMPMVNILNGGTHANNSVDFQEFMIVPISAPSFTEALRMCTEVFHWLGQLLKDNDYSVSVGDEGGFAPNLSSNELAIEFCIKAIEKAGYKPGHDIYIALDIAASEFYDKHTQLYTLKKSSGKKFISQQLIEELLQPLILKYPIVSIEDAIAEDDWNGWSELSRKMGHMVQLVGDDLFVTNKSRLQNGINKGIANAILIKVNQVGTLTETMDTIELAQNNQYNTIVSHRSGETEDTTIADLAVATNSKQIKTGSVCRSERTAKYNRLLQIETELEDNVNFANDITFFRKSIKH